MLPVNAFVLACIMPWLIYAIRNVSLAVQLHDHPLAAVNPNAMAVTISIAGFYRVANTLSPCAILTASECRRQCVLDSFGPP